MNWRLNHAECLGPGGDRPQAPRAALPDPRPATPRSPRSHTGFSLIEVMIACGIFFMAIFAILALISSVLRNARGLRRIPLDAGMVAAQVANTNKLYEGTQTGDFGKAYQDYSWEADTFEPPGATNGLFQVDIIVRRQGLQRPVDTMSIWLYRPESPPPQ